MARLSMNEEMLEKFFEVDMSDPLARQDLRVFFSYIPKETIHLTYADLAEDERLTATHVVTVPEPYSVPFRQHVFGFHQKGIPSAQRNWTVKLNPEYNWPPEPNSKEETGKTPSFIQIERSVKNNVRRYTKIGARPTQLSGEMAVLALDQYGPYARPHQAGKVIEHIEPEHIEPEHIEPEHIEPEHIETPVVETPVVETDKSANKTRSKNKNK